MAGRGTEHVWAVTRSSSPMRNTTPPGPVPGRHAEDFEAAWPEAVENAEASGGRSTRRSSPPAACTCSAPSGMQSRRIDNQLRGLVRAAGRPGEFPVLPVAKDDLMRRFETPTDRARHWSCSRPRRRCRWKPRRSAARSGRRRPRSSSRNFESAGSAQVRRRDEPAADRRLRGAHRVLEVLDLQGADRLHDHRGHRQPQRAETAEGFPEEMGPRQAVAGVEAAVPPIKLTFDELVDEVGGERSGLTREAIQRGGPPGRPRGLRAAHQELGADLMREFERRVVLFGPGRKWREHLRDGLPP